MIITTQEAHEMCRLVPLKKNRLYQCEYIEEYIPEEYQKIKVIYREKKKVEK